MRRQKVSCFNGIVKKKDQMREIEMFIEASMVKIGAASVCALRLEGLAKRAFPAMSLV